MKLVLLADGFPSLGKPVFVFVQQLVFQLVDLGYDISVIAPQSLTKAVVRGEGVLPRYSKQSTANGKEFDIYRPYIVTFGNGREWLYKIFKKYNQFGIISILNKVNPEVLYGHFWHNANVLKDFAIKKSLPLFVACGEGDDALERLVDTLSKDEFNKLVSAVNGVICVSSENKRKCIAFNLAREKNIIVLPNCVDDTQFYPMDSHQVRESLGLQKEDFLIIFVGGFIKRKGPDRVIAAVDKLKDKHIKMAFIGKPLGGDSIDVLGENVVFKGILEHDKLPLYLNAADLFVLPTLKEGCCNAIVEALACGIPVVSANRPFNDDILNDNNSVRVNPEKIDEIAEAISIFKNDIDFYKTKKQYLLNHSGDYSIVNRAFKIAKFIERKKYNT